MTRQPVVRIGGAKERHAGSPHRIGEVHRGGVDAAEHACIFDDRCQGGQICFPREIHAVALQMRFDLRKVLLLDRVVRSCQMLVKPRSACRKLTTSAQRFVDQYFSGRAVPAWITA